MERVRFKSGDFVILRGLDKRADLNGQQAKVLFHVPEAARYAVRIRSSREEVRVRACNLRHGVYPPDLGEALHDGSLDALRSWIDDGGDVDATSTHTRTKTTRFSTDHFPKLSLLAAAVVDNHVGLAQYLLASGADPNLQPPEEHLTAGGHSMTALAWACDMGYSDGGISRAGLVKCLLEGRARVDLPCTRGLDDLVGPSLHRALLQLPVGALVEVLPLLLSQPESPSTMAMAATVGSRRQSNTIKAWPLGAAMITYFKKYGVDSYEQHDKPDLESAEAQQWRQVIACLLEAKADPNERVEGPYELACTSPLAFACKGPHPTLVSLLVSHKADLNCVDDDYRTPLQIAAHDSGTESLKALLLAGADVQYHNPKGLTALHYTAIRNQPKAARILLEARADVNARFENIVDNKPDYQTPLLIAACTDAFEVASVLLEWKADPDQQAHHYIEDCASHFLGKWGPSTARRLLSQGDGSGLVKISPLAQAIEQANSVRMVRLLLDHGARVDNNDGLGNLPIDMFGSRGHAFDPEILQLLTARHDELELSSKTYTACFDADAYEAERAAADAERRRQKSEREARLREQLRNEHAETERLRLLEEQRLRDVRREELLQQQAQAQVRGSPEPEQTAAVGPGQCAAGEACIDFARAMHSPIASYCSRGCMRLWHKRCWRQTQGGAHVAVGSSPCLPAGQCDGTLLWRGPWTPDIPERARAALMAREETRATEVATAAAVVEDAESEAAVADDAAVEEETAAQAEVVEADPAAEEEATLSAAALEFSPEQYDEWGAPQFGALAQAAASAAAAASSTTLGTEARQEAHISLPTKSECLAQLVPELVTCAASSSRGVPCSRLSALLPKSLLQEAQRTLGASWLQIAVAASPSDLSLIERRDSSPILARPSRRAGAHDRQSAQEGSSSFHPFAPSREDSIHQAIEESLDASRLKVAMDLSLEAMRLNQTTTFGDCCICLETMRGDEPRRYLRCAHAFHSRCIDSWLSTGAQKCPECNTAVLPEGSSS